MKALQWLASAWPWTWASRRIGASARLDDIVELARQEARRDPLAPHVGPQPLLSFVTPVFNPPRRFLEDLIASFSQQIEAGAACELILSDDASTHRETLDFLDGLAHPHVRVIRSEVNRGIAATTNAGIRAARGEWVAFLDHDDALTPFAADRITRAILQHPRCVFLYTDEVVADARLRPVEIFFKPAWDPVLLSGVNYVNHLSVYRRDRLIDIGCLREGYEGSQDYDLVLRYTADLSADAIMHLPYPAYLWRRTGETFSATQRDTAVASARRALGERFGGRSYPIPVGEALTPDLHRLRFDQTQSEWPSVSVIVPTKDQLPHISKLLTGLENTNYPKMDVILVDNGSEDPKVLDLYKRTSSMRMPLQVLYNREAFNFSRSVNRGLGAARGQVILLLNNDIEVTEPMWLKEMVSCLQYGRVGVVGARLLYPDRKIQHAGVIVGFGELAGHWYIGEPQDFPGPQGRLRVRNSYSAVTGACFLISRECLEAVGPFDEEAFAIAYNDVDFCLRARQKGFAVIWTPFATLIHHESLSRGSDETPENIGRFNTEKQNLMRRHATNAYIDPAVSPWLSRDRSYPTPITLQKLPEAR